MNVCDHRDCPAPAANAIFVGDKYLTLCEHHTNSLRHALNSKGCYITPLSALEPVSA